MGREAVASEFDRGKSDGTDLGIAHSCGHGGGGLFLGLGTGRLKGTLMVRCARSKQVVRCERVNPKDALVFSKELA